MNLFRNTSPQVTPILSPLRVGIVLASFLLTFFILQQTEGIRAIELCRPLNEFPAQLGPWILDETRSSSAEVVELLGVDDYIDYTYTDPKGDRVNLYVGFYSYVGGGKGYHSPKNCLPGGGWGIDQTKTLTLTSENITDKPVTIAEMVIREGNEYQVVLYWFQNRGRIIASEYWEKIYLVQDALLKKRRDGAFVRLMAYAADGDIASTEHMLKKFAERAMVELKQYLPGK